MYLVGSFKGLEPPKVPKDDSNVSRKGKTPEEKGARPCRHCGSGKHWDNECQHSFKGNRAVRANLSQISGEETIAQNKYNDLYYSLSDSETEQDFHEPLKNYISDCLRVALCNVTDSLETPLEDQNVLENRQHTPVKSEEEDYLKDNTHLHPSELSSKPPLN